MWLNDASLTRLNTSVTRFSMSLIIRQPTLEDASALAEIGRSTFVDTFGHLYSAENLTLFVGQAYSLETAANDIADPDRLLRVVERDGDLIAYCKLGLTYGFEYDVGDRKVMELKQLYLRAEAQGTGIAQDLMQWAFDEAHARGFDAIALTVWSENYKAQRFYEKHGFVKWADTHFMVGNHRDDEYIYGLDLA